MKFSLIFLAASVIPAALAGGVRRRPRCLTDAKADRISRGWTTLWEGKFGGLSDVLTENFIYYSKDSTLNDEPAARGRQAMKDFIFSDSLDATTQETTVVSLRRVFEFHSCDKIAVKWKYTGKSTGIRQAEDGIGAGKLFTYEGIDILTIDLASGKVKEAEEYQNFVYFANKFGYELQPKSKS